jgi:hypothetical protein
MMDGRRTLSFSSVAEVMPEVDRLLAGHRTVGNWNLGQICNHLSDAFRLSIEGFPMRAPWLVRKLIGPVAKRRVFSKGAMPSGVKLPEKFAPRPGLDARAEAEALRAAIRLFSAGAGPLAPHPVFGPLTVAEWHRLHCIHCAHHLGFAVPSDPGLL